MVFGLILFAVLVLGIAFGRRTPVPAEQPRAERSLASLYEPTWRTDFHLGIAKTFAAHRISGCGEFKYKQRIDGTSEYVVYCTADGTTWRSYLVWPSIERLMGPHAPDASLN